MGGDTDARHNLGVYEYNKGNMDRVIKHHMLAAGGGDNDSLKKIQEMFMNGEITKDDYTKALQAYQAYLSEIRSPQRDEAAAFDEDYKYY